MEKGNRQGRALRRARTATLLAVLVAVIVSLAFDSGLGTPSSFGIGEFFLLCPLGGLEAFLASKAFLPVTAISLAVVLVLALLFGRGWCAWGCPVPPIRRFFKREPKFAGIGSGAGPRLVSVCKNRKDILVTRCRPSTPMPPMASVTQVGSPPKSSLYSGVRRWRTRRSLMTNWSMSSWAPCSSSTPLSRSRWM